MDSRLCARFGFISGRASIHLTPHEQEKLLIVVVVDLTRGRKDRGIQLNHSEAIVYITAETLEGAREGRTVTDLMAYGTILLAYDGVMEGVPEMIRAVQVEVIFSDGIKLVPVRNPTHRRLL